MVDLGEQVLAATGIQCHKEMGREGWRGRRENERGDTIGPAESLLSNSVCLITIRVDKR
jgi:hypothetical protein